MATNNSGTYVHVHTEDRGTVVVGPGEDFPSGVDVDPGLTGDSGGDSERVVSGPGQRSVPADGGVKAAWKDVTTAEIRAALAGQTPPVDYDEKDRKDALIEKAAGAGLTAADVQAHAAQSA